MKIEFVVEAIHEVDGKFKALVSARTDAPAEIELKGKLEIVGLKKNQKKIIEALTKKTLNLT